MLHTKFFKIILVIFLSLFYLNGYSQVTAAKIGVDGFTCSLCAKGVEGQLKSLDFVQSVSTDLKNATFTLKFNNKAKIDLDKIREAVSDGGFTLRDIEVDAKGKLEGTEGNYKLKTGNSPSIALSNVTGDFNTNDNVSIKGFYSLRDNIVKLETIKKIK